MQRDVFPKLRKLCADHGCEFQAIDLRWGVSTEAALDQRTMDICLTELERCRRITPRPNFLVLLGDRYGWIPAPLRIEASEFEAVKAVSGDPAILYEWYRLDTNAVPSEYMLRPRRPYVSTESGDHSWRDIKASIRTALLAGIERLGWPTDDPRRVKYEFSATHQEILRGALDLPDEREHVFAFFRDIRDLPPAGRFSDAGTAKVQALKANLEALPGIHARRYSVTEQEAEASEYLDRLCEDVLARLTPVLTEEIERLKHVDPHTAEDIAHREFGAERRKIFVGQARPLEAIRRYVDGVDRRPLVLYGESGTGKTALLAARIGRGMAVAVV